MRGATEEVIADSCETMLISIHAPREGRDSKRPVISLRATFQSTRPVRGATFFTAVWAAGENDFNPRAP